MDKILDKKDSLKETSSKLNVLLSKQESEYNNITNEIKPDNKKDSINEEEKILKIENYENIDNK